MAVKIRLKRVGKVHMPYYRIVVADSRTKRDGRFIEQIGKYHPKDDPSLIEVDSDRVQYWLGVGAQPSEPVRALLRKTGDWQKFKGEPAPEPLLVAKPKRDRDDAFNQALKDAGSQPKDEEKEAAPKRSSRKKAAAAEPKAEAESADEAAPATEAEATSDAGPSDAGPSEAESSEAELSEAGDDTSKG